MHRAAVIPTTILVALGAGCRSVAHVVVTGSEDGSGTVAVAVELDAEAAAALGGPDEVVLDDLDEAGWEVEEPAVADDGALTFRAERRFRDSADLAQVLDEVGTTADGTAVFSDTAYEVRDGFGRTDYELSTTVRASGDPAQFGDAALTGVLGGLPLGWAPDELAAAGATAPGAAELRVDLRVPEGGADSARLDLTGGTPVEESLTATGAQVEVLVWVLAGLGAVLVAVAAGSLVFRGRRPRS